MTRARSRWEATLEQQLRVCGLKPEVEYVFAPPRRWRFDFAWPAEKVAAEVEGGLFSQGRHTRGAGFSDDIEKYNAAAMAGWLLIRCTPEMVKSGEAVQLIEAAIHIRRAA